VSVPGPLALQTVVGNQAMQRLLRSGAIQAKLTISQPDDPSEQEADRVAEEVMRMPDPRTSKMMPVSRPAHDKPIQRLCEECEEELHRQPMEEVEEEETLRAKTAPGHTSEVTPDVEADVNALRDGGQPLPDSVRAFFEPRFGHDFSRVRVHTDAKAAESAQAVSALAYTVGDHVVFGRGRYAPHTSTGLELLTHELTHVIQQGRSQPSSTTLGLIPDSDASEMEAKRVATASPQGAIDIMALPPGGRMGVARNSEPKRRAGFRVRKSDLDNLRETMLRLLDRLDKETRETVIRNKTIAIGLVLDPEGEPRLVYTTSGNWTNESLRKAVEAEGLTRWDPRPVVEGRGGVGAPADAEQLMLQESEGEFRVRAMAVSREVCDDCKEAIRSYEKGKIKVVEVHVQRRAQRGGRGPRGGGGSAAKRPTRHQRVAPSVPTPEAETAEAPRGGRPRAAGRRPSGGIETAPGGARTAVVGSLANIGAAFALGLLQEAFREKILADLEKLPKPEKDERGAVAYLRDPGTAESVRLLDLFNKNLPLFQKHVEEHHEKVKATVFFELAATAVGSVPTPEGQDRRSLMLDEIHEELKTYGRDLDTISDNLDALLELEASALKAAQAAEDLREALAYLADALLKSGWTIEDIVEGYSSADSYASSIRRVFQDARALRASLDKIMQEQDTLEDGVNKLWWEEFGERLQKELAARQEAAERERARAATAEWQRERARKKAALTARSPWELGRDALVKASGLLDDPAASEEEKEAALAEMWRAVGAIENVQKRGFAHAEERSGLVSLKSDLLREIGKFMDAKARGNW
jgi:hypothetical protein